MGKDDRKDESGIFGETVVGDKPGGKSEEDDLFGETVVRPEDLGESIEAGRLIAGRYRVVRELGRGGMGVVYLVQDTHLRDREVALKKIHPALIRHPEAERRFEDEVIISQELAHDNIVRVFSLERDDDDRFFTMEYLPGRSLREIIEERKAHGKPFSLTEAAMVIGQVLDALAYAHQRTIHRDIKPDNIMCIGDWPEVKVKVMDFGIAKTLSSSRMTTTAQSMGTAYYMAPEQLAGAKDVTPASDLYSVGAVLYEMLTGKIPAGRFDLPGAIVPGLPPELDNMVDRALKAEPGARFNSAGEFRSALAPVIDQAEKYRRESEKRRRLEEEAQRQAEEERRRLEEEKRRVEDERLRQEAERRRAAESEQVKAEDPGKSRRTIGWLIVATLAVVVAVGGYLGLTWYQNKVAEEKRIAAQRREEEARRKAAARKAAKPKPTPKPAKPKYVAKPAAKPAPEPGKAKKYFTNSIGMRFRLIPAGSFQMGSPSNEQGRFDNEGPRHRVVISRAFYLQTAEVTNAQFRSFVQATGFRTEAELQGFGLIIKGGLFHDVKGANWRHPHGPDSSIKGKNNHPVVMLSWNDARAFCTWLSQKTGHKYRLPTEAEWEYSCRAGSRTAYTFGDDRTHLGEYAWYSENSGGNTHPVGQKKPNSWGLYDMHGNVIEWCKDRYAKYYYRQSPTRDPMGPSLGQLRITRGGSWFSLPGSLRSARRGYYRAFFRCPYVGFRVVRDP